MKITKRIISLIAAVAVLATMFVAVPVSAATTTTDLLKIDFNNEDADTRWTALKYWSDNATDGFYGAAARHDVKTQVESDSGRTYLEVGEKNVNSIEFKNVGTGQTEDKAVDDAQYFGADSTFGKPYYVEMNFRVPGLQSTSTIFGQYFAGKLNDSYPDIVSTGPRVGMDSKGYLEFTDGLATGSNTAVTITARSRKDSCVVTANTWHHLKVYVDPVNRTYQVWFDNTAIQKTDEEGTEPTAFKFGAVNTNKVSDTGLTAGSNETTLIGTQNINEYLEANDMVLAPNRTRFQVNDAKDGFHIDNIHMYRIEEVEGEDPVEPEDPEVTDDETVLNWTFDSETADTKWTALSIWSNTADGFYGQNVRYATGTYGVKAHTATGKTGNYYLLRSGAASTAQFKSVGVGQTESTVVDSAQYFGADSLFGKPYYVEFDFSVDAQKQIAQLFGQHFEGTLADGTTTVYTSGPAIRLNSSGYMQFSDGFASDTSITQSNITSTTIQPVANQWYHLKIYIDPSARTYQVWLDNNAVGADGSTGTEAATFEFGAVQNNAGSDVDAGAGNTNMALIGGYNPNKYIKDAGIVLAPNRTRFQSSSAGLSIDELHIYYPPERDLIASEIIAAFNDANNNGAIAEGTDSITLPGLPSAYDSAKYTVSWSSDNARINTTTGAIADGLDSDAVLTLTVTDASGETATATAKVSLPFSFTSWVANPVPYEISGIKFQDVDAEEDSYIYSPVAGGTLSSAQFKNNTQNAVNLIAAAYDASGRLAACKVVGGPDDGEVAIDLDIPATATNPVVKFFVWSADDKLTPLTTSAQVFEEAGRKLVIISDSRITEGTTTMGAVLADKFDTTKLPITDLSVVGTTLKRYATEEVSGSTRLQTALAAINPGDYVMLSFGHNDRYDTTWGEPTTAGEPYNVGSFGYYYLKYVEAIRLAGGVPIIVTPAPKGTFYADGTSSSGLKNWSTHAYNVATDYDVPFLNLHEEGRSGTQIDSENPNPNCLNVLGKTNSEAYYDADTDLLTADGAEWIADMLVDMMTVVKLPFVKYAD